MPHGRFGIAGAREQFHGAPETSDAEKVFKGRPLVVAVVVAVVVIVVIVVVAVVLAIAFVKAIVVMLVAMLRSSPRPVFAL